MTLTSSSPKSLVTVSTLPAELQVDSVMDDNPRRELRIGVIVVVLFFVIFLGWSLFARLDAAAYAPGAISVAGHRQTVQHEGGGTVKAIYVKEGQTVKAGDILLQLQPSDVGAATSALGSQVIGLQAQIARLEAERLGSRVITPPAAFAALEGDEKLDADHALHLQQRELQARLFAISSQKAILNQRASQAAQMVQGYKGQVASSEEQARLINEELAGTRSLAEKGYASTNRVRALERTAAGLSGQKAELAAGAARAQDQIAETRMQALSIDSDHAESVAKELRDAQYQLNEILPRYLGMKDKLAGASIKAPATGQVVGLSVFTVGGVVAPGAKIMDIVPDDAGLVIEAQIMPDDASDLFVGQEAEVKITAMHERDLPILKGKVSRLSADSFSDERTGHRYFTAEVTVPPESMKAIEKVRGKTGSLKPGLPVQVLIPLRKRSAFQYLTEPLTQAMWKSFREK